MQDAKLDDVLLAHHLQPAEGPGTIALLELCLRLPAATATALLTIDFQKAFLTVFDHPPDAHRGFDVPAALFTFLDAKAEHQVIFAIYAAYLGKEHCAALAKVLPGHYFLFVKPDAEAVLVHIRDTAANC